MWILLIKFESFLEMVDGGVFVGNDGIWWWKVMLLLLFFLKVLCCLSVCSTGSCSVLLRVPSFVVIWKNVWLQSIFSIL